MSPEYDVKPSWEVLYVSGCTDDAMVRHGVLESQVVFLQKPDTPLLLVRKVRDVLNAVMQIELGERFVNDMAKAIGMP